MGLLLLCRHIYTGRINQHLYITTLENCLIPSAELLIGQNNYIFQQDGATAHTANSVKEWISQSNIELLPWCPRSPDLNPIENIWAWMDHQMARVKITLIENLKEVLHQTWLTVPDELCRKLIDQCRAASKHVLSTRVGTFVTKFSSIFIKR